MKIVQLNATCGQGSTGKICVSISKILNEKNIENYIIYSLYNSDYPQGIKFSNKIYGKIQALKSHIFGNWGFNSQLSTKKLIQIMDKINPDIVHIHNIHTHDFNLSMLFDYLKNKKVKIFWTFHDCWAMTAYCPHFITEECNKWKVRCEKCPQYKQYSWFVDNSKKIYERKKNLFKGLDITIITPSNWLTCVVKQSFLKSCQVRTINNGINLDIFKPTKSNFREVYKIKQKYIVLGVSFVWNEKKGLDVFIRLSKLLNDDYKIVLVGTNSKIDKILPTKILSIHKIKNQKELAEIYSAADIFVNPTREDTYPTVNMEAIACGTPVITFKTCGSLEMLDDTCGCGVEIDDINMLKEKIEIACEYKKYNKEDCIEKARQFNEKDKFEEYISLYDI